jgi:hypothetical protein
MAIEFKKTELGQVGLITETEDGRIIQLGMTEEQSSVLQVLVASMSREKPFIKIEGENELIPKWKISNP